MEVFRIKQGRYNIIFVYNETLLNISINPHESMEEKDIKFVKDTLILDETLKKYFQNFKDLINQMKQNKIQVTIKENFKQSGDKILLKYLDFKIDGESNITRKIYIYNIEYYLTKNYAHERINSEPFLLCIKKDSCNLEDILELIDNENILSNYNIGDIKYFNEEKKAFQKMTYENINIGEKLILELQINEIKNLIINNLKWKAKYLKKELISLKNRINKYSDITRKYDLIYLYASPIIKGDHFEESDSPISYMEEIKIILDLMAKKRKQFNCKFECINEEVFRNILANNKTKILHISSHGIYDGKSYSIRMEDLKKNGQGKDISKSTLESMLKLYRFNLSQIDLVIASTCYSQDLAELFFEYGVKNIIYIERETEIIDSISVLFVKYFYKRLLEGQTIGESFNNTIKRLKIDKDILIIQNNACCCTHYHKPNCNLSKEKIKENFHSEIHAQKSEKCKCSYEQPHHHNKKKCDYFDLFKKKIKDEEVKDIKEDDPNVNVICCCNSTIEHNEILKIKYKSKPGNYSDIFPFYNNGIGNIFIDSKIKLYFDEEKFTSIIGRKNIMGRIFKDITNKGKFFILYGEKEMRKTDFTESFCVYLYERKIIIDYVIYKINSEFDYIYLTDKLSEIINNNENIENKKKIIIVIKFDIEDNDKIFSYLTNIYKKFCSDDNRLYIIFILNITEEKYIIDNISEIKGIKLEENDKNIFYAGMDGDSSLKLLKYYIKEYNLNIKIEDCIDLLKSKTEYKPKKIKLLSELLIQGEPVENIKKMKEIEMPNIVLVKDNLSFPLYYLLLNMPSGLPNCFLELIFDNYYLIQDNKRLLIKSPDNFWNLINKDKRFEDNFKEVAYMDICYIHIFKTLKLYARLLNYFIEKNKERINDKDGNIHYIYNSYNKSKIWKSKIDNTIGKLLGNKILNKDFSIMSHKENILNIMTLIINKIELFRKKQIREDIDFYLEEILLLFPSYFFLKKENKYILLICISLCKNLISNTKDEIIKIREELLKQKLLLYLYSISESNTEILEIKNNLDSEIKNNILFLQAIRDDNKIENMEKLLTGEITDEMKFNLYYEIAIIYFKNKQYNDCLQNLENAYFMKTIKDVQKDRIIIDYCYSLKNKFIEENKDQKNNMLDINNSKIQLLNEIIEKPLEKNQYYEAYNLRNDIYNLLPYDIVMLNANPLKKITNYFCPFNNQCYILSEIKKNINEFIRIKPNILNEQNLKEALNGKGEILIIQSDDFIEEGDIICESEEGESILLQKEDLFKMLINNKINYKIIILCFQNSYKLKEYLDNNHIDYPYLISFKYIEHSQIGCDMMKELNQLSVQFIIDFIINSMD